jgi:hypothetical protein
MNKIDDATFERGLEKFLSDHFDADPPRKTEIAFTCSYNVHELGYDINLHDPKLKAKMAKAIRKGKDSFKFKRVKFTRIAYPF